VLRGENFDKPPGLSDVLVYQQHFYDHLQ
jgi:hypothetical protein